MKAEHQTNAASIDGRDFTAYAGRTDDAENDGVLIVTGANVQAIPALECSWREGNKGNFRVSKKPRGDDGAWHPWFLLTRLLVLDRMNDEAAQLSIAPAVDVDEATRHFTEAKEARRRADDMRAYTITRMMTNDDFPPDTIADPVAFRVWYGLRMADAVAAGDMDFLDAITGFTRIARSMPVDPPAEIRDFCKALGTAFRQHGRLPTKGEVRDVMENNFGNQWGGESAMLELRKRAGFQWLPSGKSGPRRIG